MTCAMSSCLSRLSFPYGPTTWRVLPCHVTTINPWPQVLGAQVSRLEACAAETDCASAFQRATARANARERRKERGGGRRREIGREGARQSEKASEREKNIEIEGGREKGEGEEDHRSLHNHKTAFAAGQGDR